MWSPAHSGSEVSSGSGIQANDDAFDHPDDLARMLKIHGVLNRDELAIEQIAGSNTIGGGDGLKFGRRDGAMAVFQAREIALR